MKNINAERMRTVWQKEGKDREDEWGRGYGWGL